MTSPFQAQWIRKCQLQVISAVNAQNPNAPGEILDLSDLRIDFRVMQGDRETPDHAYIKVYNLSKQIATLIQNEFDRVILSAGYQSNYGTIFDGTIKQFVRGRESPIDSFLEIRAADSDGLYNFGVCATTVAAGSKAIDRVHAIQSEMQRTATQAIADGNVDALKAFGGTLPRGKVLWGMGRDLLREEADGRDCSWSIKGGKVNFIPNTGYQAGTVVELNSATGLIGIPETTENGVYARCLINPRLKVGSLVKINQSDINQIIQRSPFLPFPQYKGVQLVADVSTDGLYKVYVVEHDGDTRGPNWYSSLVCLAVDRTTQKVATN